MSEMRDPDEQGHQQRRSRSGRPCRSAAALTRLPAGGLDERHGHASAVQGREGQELMTARLAESSPTNQSRKTGGSAVADAAHEVDDTQRAGHVERLAGPGR